MVQNVDARLYVQFLVDKTAERLSRYLCTTELSHGRRTKGHELRPLEREARRTLYFHISHEFVCTADSAGCRKKIYFCAFARISFLTSKS